MTSIGRLEKNVAEILHVMAGSEMVSQTQLMSQVHLKRTSVFNIMEQMRRGRLVRSCANFSSGKGRGTIMWKPCEDAGAFVVAYFGYQHSFYCVYDFHGDLLHKVERPCSRTIGDAVRDLQQVITDFAKSQKPNRFLLRGIIVSLAGTVDPGNGEVVISHYWRLKQYPLGEELAKLWKNFSPLILVENNARLSAWGEKCVGSSRDNRHFLMLSIHSTSGHEHTRRSAIGLGTGIVLDNKLFAGKGGGAGELDEFFTDWFRTHYPNGNRPSSLGEMTDDQLRQFATDLGENFSHIVNYLAPEKLVVHFDEEQPSTLFVDCLRQALYGNLLPGRDHDFLVEMSTRGVDLLLAGGIHLLRQRYFAPSEQLLRQIREALKLH